jgi:hypothetical protein
MSLERLVKLLTAVKGLVVKEIKASSGVDLDKKHGGQVKEGESGINKVSFSGMTGEGDYWAMLRLESTNQGYLTTLEERASASSEWTKNGNVYQSGDLRLIISSNSANVTYSQREPFTTGAYAEKAGEMFDKLISLLKTYEEPAPVAELIVDDAPPTVQHAARAPITGSASEGVKYKSPEALAAAIRSGDYTIHKNMTSFMVKGQEACISIAEAGGRHVRFRIGGKTIKPKFKYDPEKPENQLRALAHVLKSTLGYELKTS